MPQLVPGIVFFVGAIALAATFIVVARRGQTVAVPYLQISATGYRIRRYWFIVLLVAAVITLILTIPRMPYASFRLSALGSDRVIVHVVASQWAWQMSTSKIPVGKVVEIQVTSKDVNHGFAIYNPQGHIVGQVQAMPGYTNTLVIRLDQPGTYEIRCLELCGLYHHFMTRLIEATA